MEKRTVFEFGPVQSFACIGEKCEDSCCMQWHIVIDKNTYTKYQKLKVSLENQEQEVKNHIKKLPLLKRKKIGYANIQLTQEKKCPFWGPNKLCGIQGQHGERALSLTCHTYPRVTNEIDGRLERTLTLSCPEASRVMLLHPGTMDFKEKIENASTPFLINHKLDSKGFLWFQQEKKYFHEIRATTLGLLQNKSFRLWERLLLLGEFYQVLEELLKTNPAENILDYIRSYPNTCSYEQVDVLSKAAQPFYHINLNLMKTLFLSLENESKFPTYQSCYTSAAQGLGLTRESMQNSSDEAFEVKFSEIRKNYFEPFLQDHEKMFENYLLVSLVRNLVPFQIFAKISEAFAVFLVDFQLLVFHLVGIAATEKILTTDKAIQLFYAYTKAFGHHDALDKRIFMLIRLQRLDAFKYLNGLFIPREKYIV